MIIRLIEALAYTGTIAAMLALSLAIFTFLFLGTGINYILLVLIFCGTLVIYNLDHLKDIDSDKTTNPKRVNFILSNKLLIYFIIGVSVVLSLLAVYFLGTHLVPLIILPFLFGLMHRIIKNSPVFSAVYITLSWLMITVYLPAYITGKPKEIIFLSIIIGVLLFLNAYTSSLRQKYYAAAYVRYMMYLSLSLILLLIIIRGNYLGLIPLSFFTTMALTNYIDDENYEVIFLDGLQLSGAVISVLFLVLIKL